MHFRPSHDRVVVRRIDDEEKTAGGIIIPDTAKEKPQEGEIVAAGPGARNEQGQLVPLNAWRPCPVRKMVWHRSENRRPGSSNHEGKRPSGRGRKDRYAEEGCLS